MANSLTTIPIIVDTLSSSALVSGTFTATKVRWVGATTAGHTVSVQNEGGIVKFAGEATGANYSESEHFDPPLIFEGLKVPTLGSGIIYIYVSSGVPVKA